MFFINLGLFFLIFMVLDLFLRSFIDFKKIEGMSYIICNAGNKQYIPIEMTLEKA